MDSDRCSVSSSNSSSSSPAPENTSMAADQMVRIEMEAAEALAGLAHLAMRENGNCDSRGKWGSKGKRGKKRVKSESPLDDSVLDAVVDTFPACSDIAPVFNEGRLDTPEVKKRLLKIFLSEDEKKHPRSQDYSRALSGFGHIVQDLMNPVKQHDEPLLSHVVNPAKLETDADIPETNLSSVKIHPSFGGGRSRQNLTEDENEERRLRRILANRESARQTIHRRQALCDELTRKAADLAWENDSLKRLVQIDDISSGKEKELALKECQSLESKNKHLKEQTDKLIKTGAEDSFRGLNSAPAEMSAAPAANWPLLLYNKHPFSTLCWPSVVQSSNALQSNHGPQNENVIPPNISLLPNGKLDSAQQQKGNPLFFNGARTPLYILSCPWFFPVADHGNGLHPHTSFGLKQVQEGMSMSNQYTGKTSSKAAALVENQLYSLHEKVKSEAATSADDRAINDLHETPRGFPPDGGDQCAARHSKGTTFSHVTMDFFQPAAAIKKETGTESEFVQFNDGICTETGQLMNSFPGNQDLYNFSSKKLVDAAAATEARKRRKQLTKLKNLHGGQCRMNC